MLHPWAPAVLNEIVVAATAPVVSVGPVTEAHSPTWMALASVTRVWLYTVSAVTVTVSVPDVGEVAGVVAELPGAPAFGSATGVSTMAPEPTDTTFPAATRRPNPARPGPAVGADAGGTCPAGGATAEPPDGGDPNPARLPPPKSPVHSPLTGALIRTDVAAKPSDEPGELGEVVGGALGDAVVCPVPPAPGTPPAVASTQEPTVTAVMSAVLVWLIVVLPV